MANKTRIYEVKTELPGAAPASFLVEATSQAAARRHISEKYVKDVSLADPKRLAELMGAGHKPELAKEEEK